MSSEVNAEPLPSISATSGLRLPPDRHCLLANHVQIPNRGDLLVLINATQQQQQQSVQGEWMGVCIGERVYNAIDICCNVNNFLCIQICFTTAQPVQQTMHAQQDMYNMDGQPMAKRFKEEDNYDDDDEYD
jgi:hypothetical protein